MKITKRQLRRIIKEAWGDWEDSAGWSPTSGKPSPGEPDNKSPIKNKAEYERGYEDALSGEPKATTGTPDYYLGFDDANESVGLSEGKLYVYRGYMGVPMVEDENEEPVGVGDMVRALLNAGDDDIFVAPQGVSPKALEKLLKQDKENSQGSIENWDSDVFSDYYSVDLDRVIRLYARLMNHTIEKVSEEDEYEDDGEYDFESTYS
jgi:hypothetical protein